MVSDGATADVGGWYSAGRVGRCEALYHAVQKVSRLEAVLNKVGESTHTTA
jgi:hypothetical protein